MQFLIELMNFFLFEILSEIELHAGMKLLGKVQHVDDLLKAFDIKLILVPVHPKITDFKGFVRLGMVNTFFFPSINVYAKDFIDVEKDGDQIDFQLFYGN
mgnify:FL=1